MTAAKPVDGVADFPKRVLCIGDGEEPEIKLVESTSLRGQYCALSHCWGPLDRHPIQTTQKNILEHYDHIGFRSLPKVYQEAVIVTRGLGFRYLWIDSFCIIQDDEVDWRREAENMGSIYEQSALVIAAAGAADPTQSCFSDVPRDGRAYSISVKDEGGSDVVLHYCLHPSTHYTFRQSPLGQRAWAFQEWQLARRRVFFTPTGLFWSCRQVELSELDTPARTELCKIDEKGLFGSWIQVLKNYSGKKLTKSSDRLIALHGIATKYRQTKKGSYIAGIWDDDIAEQLLWESAEESELAEDFSGVPSWSWAATGNQKRWVFQDIERNPPFFQTLDAKFQVLPDGRLDISTRLTKVDSQLSQMKNCCYQTFNRLVYCPWLVGGFEASPECRLTLERPPPQIYRDYDTGEILGLLRFDREPPIAAYLAGLVSEYRGTPDSL
jgi:hypothetical protein